MLHEPSEPELAGWRVQRTLIGLVLTVAACIGLYLGAQGMNVDDTAGDGGVFVTLVTLGASVAIGFFGLRYLLLGIKGGGVRFYERAVEADFHKGLGILPRRRTVPLLQIRVSGSSRLTYATAITTTGHAFRLPASLVETSDVWYLGSLGSSPIAPGGRGAKDRFEQGELTPYKHPTTDPLPDHGSPYPEIGTTPITVDVEVEPTVTPQPEVPLVSPPITSAPDTVPIPSRTPPPVPPVSRPPSPASAPAPSEAPPASDIPPAEQEMEVLMDLPDVTPPPETGRRPIPPPPLYRPPSIQVPEPPRHREMDRRGLEGVSHDTGPEEAPAIERGTPPPAPPEQPVPSTTIEPDLEDEWELEEMPAPEDEKKGPAPSARSEWEEI